MDMEEKVQICKIVALAILSDAQITDTEYDFLQSLMSRWGLSEDLKKQVLARDIGEDPRHLLKKLPSSESVDELLGELVQAVAVDGEISGSERQLLSQVGEVLEMDPGQLELLINSVKS